MRAVVPIAAGLGCVIAFAAAYALPGAELSIFARASAEVASLLSGAPLLEMAGGWLLPFQDQPLLVSEACSDTGFFILLSGVIIWHLARLRQDILSSLMLGLPLAFALSTLINALRVLCLSQAHRWVIPLLPETYTAAAHMMVGAAVFLPALIALNTALELYGHPRRKTS